MGRVEMVTSDDTSEPPNIVNQIEYAYDGWGNEIQEWQALAGSVDTGSTPSVQYKYADSPSDVNDGANSPEEAADYVRLTDVIYPAYPGTSSGRDVSYGYSDSSIDPLGIDTIMSRLATISDSTGTLAAYTYLGEETIASEDLQQPQIDLDYSAQRFRRAGPFR